MLREIKFRGKRIDGGELSKKIVDITGNKYGKLTVTAYNGGTRVVFWSCVCECGKLTKCRGGDLKSGKITSCGCGRYEKLKLRNTRHGMTGTRIYRIWRGVITRCSTPSSSSYTNYGGRGILVCEDWQSFEHFYAWAMKSGYGDELTIERKDVNGDYTAANCIWIPQKDQAKNRRPRCSTLTRDFTGKFIKK